MRKKRYPALAMWLAANGHTMKWLAEQAGIPYQKLIERQKGTVRFSIEDVEKILEVTGMTMDELKFGEVRGE